MVESANIYYENKCMYANLVGGAITHDKSLDVTNKIDIIDDDKHVMINDKYDTIVIFFNGGDVDKSQWFEFQGKKSIIIEKLSQIMNIYLYNPTTLISNDTVKKFINSDNEFMFTMNDINFKYHSNKLYNDVIKYAKKFVLISHSRGYMIANVFGKMYAKNVLGHINIDGGKPIEEYEEYLQKNKQKYDGLTDEKLLKYFDNLKSTSKNDDERKSIRSELSKNVQYYQYKQYEETITKYTYSVCVINNIYDDDEINITMQDYVNTSLKYKFEYARELKKDKNVETIWYVGRNHWLYVDYDIVDLIIKKCIHFKKN
jgi:hypothetical protein